SWKFALSMSMPLVQIYILRHLGMQVWQLQILLTLQAVTTVTFCRFWGMVCDALGHRTAIQSAAFGRVIFLIALMLIPPETSITFTVAVVAFLFEGFGMAGIMVSFQTARLQLSPRENRPMYIGTINVFSMGLSQGIGSFIAWNILRQSQGVVNFPVGPFVFSHFHVVFCVSFFCGIIAWLLAGRIGGNDGMSFRQLLRELFAANPLRIVRASVRLDSAKDPKDRIRAARRLGALGSRLGLRELAAALDDEDPLVRLAAANALGRIQSEETGYHLKRALDDHEPAVQRQAARKLGRVGDEESLRTLLSNLQRPSPLALAESIDAVGYIGNDAAILPLLMLFHRHQQQGLRRRIADALANLSGDERPEEILDILKQAEYEEPEPEE
ncbi:MAG: MFS transporter, partial [Candidatus Sumerlaeota bacterium]